MNTSDVEAITQKLLSGDFDVALLDQLVGAAYDPVSPHRAAANKALMQLQEAPELWKAADSIIEKAQNPQSRFFGVQVLDDAVKARYEPNLHLSYLTLMNYISQRSLSVSFQHHKDGKFYLLSKGKE